MEKQATLDRPSRWEIYMARRKATKALKFITTNHQKYSMDYELDGEL